MAEVYGACFLNSFELLNLKTKFQHVLKNQVFSTGYYKAYESSNPAPAGLETPQERRAT